jgi:hypothetical protein
VDVDSTGGLDNDGDSDDDVVGIMPLERVKDGLERFTYDDAVTITSTKPSAARSMAHSIDSHSRASGDTVDNDAAELVPGSEHGFETRSLSQLHGGVMGVTVGVPSPRDDAGGSDQDDDGVFPDDSVFAAEASLLDSGDEGSMTVGVASVTRAGRSRVFSRRGAARDGGVSDLDIALRNMRRDGRGGASSVRTTGTLSTAGVASVECRPRTPSALESGLQRSVVSYLRGRGRAAGSASGSSVVSVGSSGAMSRLSTRYGWLPVPSRGVSHSNPFTPHSAASSTVRGMFALDEALIGRDMDELGSSRGSDVHSNRRGRDSVTTATRSLGGGDLGDDAARSAGFPSTRLSESLRGTASPTSDRFSATPDAGVAVTYGRRRAFAAAHRAEAATASRAAVRSPAMSSVAASTAVNASPASGDTPPASPTSAADASMARDRVAAGAAVGTLAGGAGAARRLDRGARRHPGVRGQSGGHTGRARAVGAVTATPAAVAAAAAVSHSGDGGGDDGGVADSLNVSWPRPRTRHESEASAGIGSDVADDGSDDGIELVNLSRSGAHAAPSAAPRYRGGGDGNDGGDGDGDGNGGDGAGAGAGVDSIFGGLADFVEDAGSDADDGSASADEHAIRSRDVGVGDDSALPSAHARNRRPIASSRLQRQIYKSRSPVTPSWAQKVAMDDELKTGIPKL